MILFSFYYNLKVTTAFQDVVKERAFRGLVQTRNVVPRHVVPRSNNPLQPRMMVPQNHRTETGSNYQNAFNDEHWPEMWYFVSKLQYPKYLCKKHIIKTFVYDNQFKITRTLLNC